MSVVLGMPGLAGADGGSDALRNTETMVILLAITLLVSLVARRLQLPYTLVLVLVGLAIGFSPLVHGVILNPDVVLFLFLPALLFEGAWSTDAKKLIASWLPIFLLAGPGLPIALALLALGLPLGNRWTLP